jgi:hypothetical protein
MGHIEIDPMLKVLIPVYCEEINDKRTKSANLTALVLTIQVYSNTTLNLWVRGNRGFQENRPLLTLEGKGITFPWNVGDHAPNDTASYPSRPQSSANEHDCRGIHVTLKRCVQRMVHGSFSRK